MTELWISWTDEDGNHGSARWGSEKRITNQEIDSVLFDTQRAFGPPSTTV